MPVSFQDIVSSKIFNFVVGEDADGVPSEISVHEEAIAQLSEPLRILTKTGSEARAGKVAWRDVSKDTFERFVQYAYTGDYSIPQTEKRSTIKPKVNGVHKTTNGSDKLDKVENSVSAQSFSSKAPDGGSGARERIDSLGSDESPINEVHDGSLSEKLEDDGTILNQPTLPSKKNKKRAAKEKAAKEAVLKAEEAQQLPHNEDLAKLEPKEILPTRNVKPELTSLVNSGPEEQSEERLLTKDFHTLSYPLLGARDNYEGTCEPSADFEKGHNYSKVLLSHASLYILGERQLIDNLKALALFKLHKTLCKFELDNENIGDITDLARYAYSGDNKRAEESNGGLRSLVCQYMAINAKELSKDAKFMNLLVGGGQIVQDFIKLQLQRTN